MVTTNDSSRGHGPKWNRRFIDLAVHVAEWSKDPSTKVGAIIVRPDKTIASLGFNGFARGIADAPELYADRDAKLARVVHAEENAIIGAAERMKGYTMYSSLLPCAHCALLIIQTGIRCVVAPEPSAHHVERWGKHFAATRDMLAEANIELIEKD